MATFIVPRPRIIAVALSVLLCLTLRAHAESSPLPEAPKPRPVFTAVDWSLSAALFATHVGDYLSTEQCVHHVDRCHEAELPNALVRRDGLFAVYEFSTATAEAYGAYKLAKMGHPRLARWVQLVNVGYTSKIVAHNYELSWHTPRFVNGGL
jgi:hypothetical protein